MRNAEFGLGLLLALWLAATSSGAANAREQKSGTVEISQVQVGAVLGQTVGGGTLRFAGRSYPFNLGGLGAVGGGAPSITAAGEVYGLSDLSHFSGTYREDPGAGPSPTEVDRTVTLINEHGVRLRLQSRRPDARLRLGPTGARIRLDLE